MLRGVFLSMIMSAPLLAQTTAPKLAAPSPKPAPAKPAHASPSGAAKAAPSTAKPVAPAAGTPVTDEEKTIYALGLLVQRSLRPFDLTSREIEIIKRALTDSAAGKPAVP